MSEKLPLEQLPAIAFTWLKASIDLSPLIMYQGNNLEAETLDFCTIMNWTRYTLPNGTHNYM